MFRATVLHDRPFPHFQPIGIDKRHNLFVKLMDTFPSFRADDADHRMDVAEATAFTERFIDGRTLYKPNRPAILVSSTSWTPDEDFGILLQALESKARFIYWPHSK